MPLTVLSLKKNLCHSKDFGFWIFDFGLLVADLQSATNTWWIAIRQAITNHPIQNPKSKIQNPIAVALIAFTVYLFTLAPTITWQHGGADSGELAAAVATLGIPHPPGYPTYVLLGYLWTALPLGGDLAYRLNLLSAVGAAIASGLTAATILDWGDFQNPKSKIQNILSPALGENEGKGGLEKEKNYQSKIVHSTEDSIGAVMGGLLLAFAPITWSQAVITEVYAPGLAVLSLLSWLLLSKITYNTNTSQNLKSKIQNPLAGLIGGLGFGILPQIVLVIPGALGLLYWRTKRIPYSLFLYFLLGLTIFAYLPLRAAAHPFVNWGDPTTFSRFWAVVTVAQYHQYASLLTPWEWLSRLVDSLFQLGQALSWTGLGLAVLGGYALWHSERDKLGYILSLTGLTILFRTSYPVMGNIVYLLPALYGLALLAGLGTTWLLTKAQPHIGQIGVILLSLGFMLTLGVRVIRLAPQLNLSHDDQAARFGEQVFTALPPNTHSGTSAIIVSTLDETTFSLWYWQALGERPDVLVVDKRLMAYDWYQNQLKQRHPDLNFNQLVTKINRINKVKSNFDSSDNHGLFYMFNEKLELQIVN